MAYFNLHKMQKLIFQLNLIVGNSLDESIKVVLHRPQCSLIDCVTLCEWESVCVWETRITGAFCQCFDEL